MKTPINLSVRCVHACYKTNSTKFTELNSLIKIFENEFNFLIVYPY